MGNRGLSLARRDERGDSANREDRAQADIGLGALYCLRRRNVRDDCPEDREQRSVQDQRDRLWRKAPVVGHGFAHLDGVVAETNLSEHAERGLRDVDLPLLGSFAHGPLCVQHEVGQVGHLRVNAGEFRAPDPLDADVLEHVL